MKKNILVSGALIVIGALAGCGGGGGNTSAPPPASQAEKSWVEIENYSASYAGTYFGRGVLNSPDGSRTLVFSGPAAGMNVTGYFTCDPVAFKALKVDILGKVSDVSALLNQTSISPMHAAKSVVADFNDDGIDDIYFGNSGCDNSNFPSYGKGETANAFVSKVDGSYLDKSFSLPPISSFVHSLAAGDLRKTGKTDILVGVLGMQNNPGLPMQYQGPNTFGNPSEYVGPYILRTNSDGTFTYDNTSLPDRIASPINVDSSSPGRFTASAIADLNGDGYPDLILGSDQTSDVAGNVYFNDGTGSFRTQEFKLPVGLFGSQNTITVDIVAVDVNSDGKKDLLLSQTSQSPYYSQAKIQALINKGNGVFSDETATVIPNQKLNKGWAQYIHVVDINVDGCADILLEMDHPDPADAVAYQCVAGGTYQEISRSKLPTSVVSLNPLKFSNRSVLTSVTTDLAAGKLTVKVFEYK